MEIWDFAVKSHELCYSQSLSARVITGIYTHELPLDPQLVAFCDSKGFIRIHSIPDKFIQRDPTNDGFMREFLDQEIRIVPLHLQFTLPHFFRFLLQSSKLSSCFIFIHCVRGSRTSFPDILHYFYCNEKKNFLAFYFKAITLELISCVCLKKHNFHLDSRPQFPPKRHNRLQYSRRSERSSKNRDIHRKFIATLAPEIDNCIVKQLKKIIMIIKVFFCFRPN